MYFLFKSLILLLSVSWTHQADKPSRTHKVKGTAMSSEMCLPRFIQYITNPDKSWVVSTRKLLGRRPVSVCTWKGVICDSSNEVVKITWLDYGLLGKLNWDSLPLSLRSFHLRGNVLLHPITLEDFPAQVHEISAPMNSFSGELQLRDLPDGLRILCLDNNSIEGRVQLGDIQIPLEYLSLERNGLSGSLDLSVVPASLHYLSLSANKLSGELHLHGFLHNLNVLLVAENSFSGILDVP